MSSTTKNSDSSQSKGYKPVENKSPALYFAPGKTLSFSIKSDMDDEFN